MRMKTLILGPLNHSKLMNNISKGPETPNNDESSEGTHICDGSEVPMGMGSKGSKEIPLDLDLTGFAQIDAFFEDYVPEEK